MNPPKMSDEEIATAAGRQGTCILMAEAAFARAIIAARDAQWVAMIGEPVAAIHFAHKKPELRQLSWNLSVPNVLRAKGWISTPLYAIKETP